MAIHKLSIRDYKSSSLETYKFRSEGSDKISPQEIISSFPQMIFGIQEVEIPDTVSTMVAKEYSTSSGPIDILMITENADVVLIETKLFRNPESHRTVVAQAIDYTKALTNTNLDSIKSNLLKSNYSERDFVEKMFKQDLFCAALNQNIKTGNFKVIIVGDKIHPNILEMVESIQSAPHLSFTLYLVELCPYVYDEDNILLHPKIVANTNEIERSVIRLEIDYKEKKTTIESSVPEKEGKGSRPILTADQYIGNLSKREFGKVIQGFWRTWKELGGDIRFGQVGFSSGMIIGKKRIAIQFVYNNRIALVSDNYRNSYGISDETYGKYKSKISQTVPRAYDFLISNKVEIQFELLSESDLENIFDATILLAREEME